MLCFCCTCQSFRWTVSLRVCTQYVVPWETSISKCVMEVPEDNTSKLYLHIVLIEKWKCIQNFLQLSSGLFNLKNSPAFPFCCRGHMPEWYTKSFGHLCAAEVVKIRDSFCNQNTETKDTKSRWSLKQSTMSTIWAFVSRTLASPCKNGFCI